MHGEQTRRAIAAQPEWLAQVPTDRRFPDGARLLFTGCGTSFHAAMTGGEAVQALELVLRPERDADLLVLVSHEGETPLTLEAARAWRGPRWLVTGRADGPIAELCDEVVVCTPEIEESWCHTASYTCAVAAIAALHGEDISWLPAAVEEALAAPLPAVGGQERFLVAAQAASSRPRTRRCSSCARAPGSRQSRTRPSSSSTATSPRSTSRCAPSSSRAKGVAAERAAAAAAALRELGCEVDLLPTRHPVVDIVLFQRLTVELAERRGREPDRIRRHDPRWAAAADAAKADNAA